MSMYKIAAGEGWWNSYLSAMRGDAPEKLDRAGAERKALLDIYKGDEKRVADLEAGRSKYDRTAEDWRNERAQLARDVRNRSAGREFYDLKKRELANRVIDAVGARNHPENFNAPRAVAGRGMRDGMLRSDIDAAKKKLRIEFQGADSELERRMINASNDAAEDLASFQKSKAVAAKAASRLLEENAKDIDKARARTWKARGGTALAAAGLLWGGKKLYDSYVG